MGSTAGGPPNGGLGVPLAGGGGVAAPPNGPPPVGGQQSPPSGVSGGGSGATVQGGASGSQPPTGLAALNAQNNQPTSTATPSGQTDLPSSLTNAYQNSSQVYGQLGTDALQMIPAAQNFINAEMGPGLTPANQAYLDYSGGIGRQALANTINQVQGQFDNAPFSSAMLPATYNAANNFALNMGQTGAGLANTQQQVGAGLASLPYNTAFQAATAGPTLQSSLLGQASQNQLGPAVASALQAYQSAPASGSAVVSGGKKG